MHSFVAPPAEIVSRAIALASTPVRDSTSPKRAAVALDCEMAAVRGAFSEVVSLCAIDYLTGEVLVDTLVSPTTEVIEWATSVSGVSAEKMQAAVEARRALKGWEEARAELWRHVDAETVLVGQGLGHDLAVLSVQHTRIVDSAVLTEKVVMQRGKEKAMKTGLKALCSELLEILIQGGVHDALEDAFAAREVVRWCLEHPADLKEWKDRAPKKAESRRVQQPRRPSVKFNSHHIEGDAVRLALFGYDDYKIAS